MEIYSQIYKYEKNPNMPNYIYLYSKLISCKMMWENIR